MNDEEFFDLCYAQILSIQFHPGNKDVDVEHAIDQAIRVATFATQKRNAHHATMDSRSRRAGFGPIEPRN